MKISRISVPLITAIPFIPIFLGYSALLFGGSIIISEWSTDRMLFQQKQFFENLIESQENFENLKVILNELSVLAEKSSVFNILGTMLLLGGGSAIILGIILLQFNENLQEKFYKNNTVMPKLSDNSLFIMFSTFFAVSLIFISVTIEIIAENEQTLFTVIIQLIQDVKTIDKMVPLFNSFLHHTSFQFALNTFNSGYFAILGLTFLIIYILKKARNIIAIAIIDYLIYTTIASLILWVIIFIAVVGITSPPQIPNVELPSEF